MTTLTLLSTPGGPLLGALAMALYVALLYAAIMAAVLRAHRWASIGLFALLLLLSPALYVLLGGLVDSKPSLPECRALLAAAPAAAFWSVLAVMTAASAGSLMLLSRWRASHITPLSIKDSLDSLPAGIVIASADGTPVMMNLTMENLCLRLTGSSLQDTRRFWQLLTEKSLSADSGGPIVPLPDGTILTFRRDAVAKDGAVFEQISAVDVTELYERTRALREKNEELAAMKRRLIRYGSDVARTTREQEILAAKIAVHDDVGHALLAAARYLEQPGEIDAARVLDTWRDTIALLSGDIAQDREADAAAALIRAAAAVGVTVTVEGVLPEENPARNLIVNALHECITNTLKHAQGDRLVLTVAERPDRYVVTLRNNGRLPDGPIRETGGLRLLRQMTESAGGRMTVRTSPAFTLILQAPKGGAL